MPGWYSERKLLPWANASCWVLRRDVGPPGGAVGRWGDVRKARTALDESCREGGGQVRGLNVSMHPDASRRAVPWVGAFVCLLLVFGAAVPVYAVEDLVLAGSDALYRGDAAQAEATLAEAVRRNPEDDFAMNQLGLALARQERFAEARGRFAEVARRSPDNVFALTWLGVLDLQADDASAAVARFKQVLAASPEDPTALYLLGVEAATRRDLVAAAHYFRRSSVSGTGDPQAQYRLAEAYRGLGMPDNARLCYERALKADPRHASALVGYGWNEFSRGRRDKAVAAWERALMAVPGHPQAQAALATVLVREGVELFGTGRLGAAQARFQRALVYEPENKAALYYLRRMPPEE